VIDLLIDIVINTPEIAQFFYSLLMFISLFSSLCPG